MKYKCAIQNDIPLNEIRCDISLNEVQNILLNEGHMYLF